MARDDAGGEKVLEALCELFPEADIFTHVYDPEAISPLIRRHKITTTFIQRLPLAVKKYQSYLPLMPLALEQLDLSSYDLVISSESGPAKGVVIRPDARHICYCHTPMRYVWDMYHQYAAEAGIVKRLLMPPLMHYLRLWDSSSAARVDTFIANSDFVARRIRKCYRRDAVVIHPPVDTENFAIAPVQGDFYLMVGQLVCYKRADIAINACTLSGRRLIVIGEGEQRSELEAMAGSTVTFLGRQPFPVIRDHFMRCRALLFPGVEDFGIVPLEAMASGRPVIAFRQGGAVETVVENSTGVFFDEQTADSLVAALRRFEEIEPIFNPHGIREHAQTFDTAVFKEKFIATLNREMYEESIDYRNHRAGWLLPGGTTP